MKIFLAKNKLIFTPNKAVLLYLQAGPRVLQLLKGIVDQPNNSVCSCSSVNNCTSHDVALVSTIVTSDSLVYDTDITAVHDIVEKQYPGNKRCIS